MLGAIRKRSAGIVVKTLLGMLILSFALWGVADVFSPGGGDNSVATVGDAKIGPEQLRREYQREIERLSNALGTPLNDEQARMFGIVDGVLNRIVDRSLYDLAASGLGILVTDNIVRDDIRHFPGFKNENGEFDRNRFQQLLFSNRLSETAYVDMMRGDVRRAQLLSIFDGGEISTPMAETLYRHRNEKRIAESVSILMSSITDIPEPTEEDLAKYHKDNAGRYTAPEFRSLTAISLKAADLAKEIAVADEAVAAAYEDRLNEFSTPEMRTLEQIRLSDEEGAKKAHSLLGTGEKFAKVAKDLADMSDTDIELGQMSKAQMPPELADVAFNLVEGGYTAPIKTVLGWHILRLVSIEPAKQKPLSDVREKIATEIATEQALDALYGLANKLEDELGSGSTLEDAARAFNLPLVMIADIGRDGSDRNGKLVENLPGSEFIGAAFNTPEGMESQLTEAGSDGYFIVRVDQVTAPQLTPLADVRNEVSEDWKKAKRAELAKQQADAMVEKINGGEDLFKLAADKGLKVTTTAPFLRSGSGDLSTGLVDALFDIQKGKSVTDISGEAYVVARVKEIVTVNAAADQAAVTKVGNELATSLRSDLMDQLARGLRTYYPVSINNQAVNAQF
ncbi:MAG: SurA N-terminal domain-containing protein [Rhodospirillaceae bacterium]|nr:SurA N-terminal domain-containing protein [Rhodospirillaceae bacterium]